MSDLLNIMNIRMNETELIIEQIENIEQGGKAFNQHVSIQKALVIMMCYNIIESTIYLSLQWLFDEIKLNCLKYSALTINIQRIYDKYYNSKKYSGGTVSIENKHHLTFEDYSKIVTTFSGNLDARKIREILCTYGIEANFHINDESELLRIKNYRNKLAHGELSYNEVGRNYTITDIRKISIAAFEYLVQYEKLFEDYITDQKYLKA